MSDAKILTAAVNCKGCHRIVLVTDVDGQGYCCDCVRLPAKKDQKTKA